MGFLAPAIPAIIKGGAAIGGALLGRKAQSSAQKRSAEEQVDVSGAQNAGTGLMQAGAQQVAAGQPAQAKASTYYQTLLRGNRAQQSQAVAAPMAAVTDIYRGAERNLERSNIRGAARDVASAELGRQRASQMASLVTGVQPAAAAALENIGTTQVNQGMAGVESGGQLFSQLLPYGQQNRVYARGEGEKAGKAIGGFIFDILGGSFKKGGGGGGLLPSRPTSGPYGFLPSGQPSGNLG